MDFEEKIHTNLQFFFLWLKYTDFFYNKLSISFNVYLFLFKDFYHHTNIIELKECQLRRQDEYTVFFNSIFFDSLVSFRKYNNFLSSEFYVFCFQEDFREFPKILLERRTEREIAGKMILEVKVCKYFSISHNILL